MIHQTLDLSLREMITDLIELFEFDRRHNIKNDNDIQNLIV